MKPRQPKYVVCDNADQIADIVSKQFIDLIKQNKKCVFIMPTGSTPCKTYAKLVQDHKNNATSWKDVITFNCDEYVMPNNNFPDQTYHYFMDQQLFNHVDINRDNIHFPNEKSKNGKYLRAIKKAGKADICFLGIGTNGHIAFNEPGSKKRSLTRIVDLTDETIQANSRFFGNDINNVPKQALSMGLKTIVKGSKKIIMIATGANKKAIIDKLSKLTKFDINIPASALLYHPNVEIYLDHESDFHK